jgi:DNA-directed RNA polymerase subunit omega
MKGVVIDMLHPSYTELMDRINSEENRGEIPAINSRYSIVIASAKRARELVGGMKPKEEGMEGEKPLSVAVKELFDGDIHILPGDDPRFDDSLDYEEDPEEAEE